MGGATTAGIRHQYAVNNHMRHFILAALSVVAFAGEVSQEEQDRIWREAMKQSAATPARQTEPAPDGAGLLAAEKAKRAEMERAGKEKQEKDRANTAARFLADYGIPLMPVRDPVATLTQIPERFRGKLFTGDVRQYVLSGEITAGSIMTDDKNNYVVSSMREHSSGDVSFVPNGMKIEVYLRLSRDGKSAILSTVDADFWYPFPRAFVLVK